MCSTKFQTTEMTHFQCTFTGDPLKLLQRNMNILIRHLKMETKKTCLFIALGVNLSSYCISNSTLSQRQTNNPWSGMLLKMDFQLKGQDARGMGTLHFCTFKGAQLQNKPTSTPQLKLWNGFLAIRMVKWHCLLKPVFLFLGSVNVLNQTRIHKPSTFLWCHNQ